jgi:hypothetical protein
LKITRAAIPVRCNDWTLENISTITIDLSGVVPESAENPWVSSVKPELLASAVAASYLSLQVLWDQLGYLQRNGLDDSVYRSAFLGNLFIRL